MHTDIKRCGRAVAYGQIALQGRRQPRDQIPPEQRRIPGHDTQQPPVCAWREPAGRGRAQTFDRLCTPWYPSRTNSLVDDESAGLLEIPLGRVVQAHVNQHQRPAQLIDACRGMERGWLLRSPALSLFQAERVLPCMNAFRAPSSFGTSDRRTLPNGTFAARHLQRNARRSAVIVRCRVGRAARSHLLCVGCQVLCGLLGIPFPSLEPTDQGRIVQHLRGGSEDVGAQRSLPANLPSTWTF